MATRSKLLGALWAPGAGGHTIYTVPAGRTAIVKTLIFWNGDAASHFLIYDGVVAGGTPALWRYEPTILTNAVDYFDTWFVLEAGDYIAVASDSPVFAVNVSGAELIG